MRILFSVAPGYGLMLPVVPLMWAARAAGHEVLVASTSDMIEVGAHAGLSMYDVVPERDVWDLLMRAVAARVRATVADGAGSGDGAGSASPGSSAEPADAAEEVLAQLPPQLRRAAGAGNPFAMFTVTMTEGTIRAARAFGADLVVYTSDHPTGALTALALGVPGLEMGNRVSWSMRDAEFRTGRDALVDDEIIRDLRAELDIPRGRPRLLARLDPRPPSMGGLGRGEQPLDPRDGVAWWGMRYVPFNGGASVADWALWRPDRPRVCVTLGTVVPAIGGGSLDVVVRALGGMDLDVVLATGKADLSGLGELPVNVRQVGFLPLSSFLPTCSVIVHHGGSGTTAAPLHYGVPQLVLPAFADNPMAAARVARRGVGLSLEPAGVDSDAVREAVRRLLTEPSFALASAEVSAEMATQPSPASVLERATRAALSDVQEGGVEQALRLDHNNY